MTKLPNYHISLQGKGDWHVRRSGAAHRSGKYPSCKEALEWCKTRAKTVFLHDKTGRIRDMIHCQ